MELRCVVVGAGGMGRAWLRAISAYDEVALAGVVDVDLLRAKEAVAELGTPEVHVATSLVEIVETHPVDFVVDVTVPEAHHAVTLAAFELGLPVLGEKPLAATMAEARELVAASEAYGKLFVVSQNRRYNAGLFALKRRIGDLGRLGSLTATFFRAPRFGGFRDRMAHPLLLDMAIHQFDAARFLTGAEPVAVYCEESNPRWSWYDGDASATAVFEMTDGIRFVFNGSWCSPGLETSWDSSWRASGEHGTALWDGKNALTAGVESDPASDPPPDETPPAEGIDGTLRDFVDALRTGRTPMGECHDNIRSLAMVHAAIESSGTGERVAVD